MDKLAAISVDLDEIDCYAAIHGLHAEQLPLDRVYRVAIDRFTALFAQLDLPATFFAIGRDLESSDNAQAIKALHDAGHEIGNHSYHHAYDLTRRAPDAIRADIADGSQIIERVTGQKPQGFRAPGYTINERVFEALSALGVGYDSSVFPCPPYYAAKAVALAWIAARGRRSHSVLDDPRVLTAPADPYRVGSPYYTRGSGMIELPIGVTPFLRLPYIGTSVLGVGANGARVLSEQISRRPFVSLELHGIDLLDASDGLQALAPHQPDVRISVTHKVQALTAAVATLRRHGFAFTTLRNVASAFSS